MSDDFSLLGAAEKFAATQLVSSISDAAKSARSLADALEEIDTSSIEELLLDADKKDTILTLIDPMRKMAGSLAMNSLIPLVLGAMLKPKETV